ncbi:MAG: hypothetical protein KF830_08895 [Planctomycetes bacterium]|nr:hypothetical protein [Planctomycetota bacterium]
MLRNTFLGLGAASLLTAAASAQQICTDNIYPVYLVDAAGNPAPSAYDPAVTTTVFQFATEEVYLAFHPNLPSGTYYVHITDTPTDGIGDQVLSRNDPMDRFVSVQNANGVITLSLPFTNNQNPVVFGAGLNGVGQSLKLTPFAGSPFTPCRWKVWYGDNWVLDNGPDNPYLLAGGIHPVTGGCAVRSYSDFVIGNGSGSDVTGRVFHDTNRNGTRDAGEGALAGWQVRLVTGDDSVAVQTDAQGRYRFPNVAAGTYTVELVVMTGRIATTAASYPVAVCACADVAVGDFGAADALLPCNAKPLCYWYSCWGLQRIQQFGVLPTLPALHLRNLCGQHVSPSNLLSLRLYLLCANSWNMAYDLSAQVLAMHANVVTGLVHPDCVLQDPTLGTMTVSQLMQQAVASLAAHGYTPLNHSKRLLQSRLRNALLRANHNWIWQ